MVLKVKLSIFYQKEKDFQWISVPDGSNKVRSFLKDVSDQNLAKFIQAGCVVIINGPPVTEDVELKDGDEIKILPMLHGG